MFSVLGGVIDTCITCGYGSQCNCVGSCNYYAASCIAGYEKSPSGVCVGCAAGSFSPYSTDPCKACPDGLTSVARSSVCNLWAKPFDSSSSYEMDKSTLSFSSSGGPVIPQASSLQVSLSVGKPVRVVSNKDGLGSFSSRVLLSTTLISTSGIRRVDIFR